MQPNGFRKAVCCIGAAIITAYYLLISYFIIIGNLRGHNVVLTFNQYREGPIELAFTIASFPIVAYFISESKKAITDNRVRDSSTDG